jgi:hypothetical protein
MKLVLSKDLAARVKGEIATQVCQLQFIFHCFPFNSDLDGLSREVNVDQETGCQS